MRLVVADTGPLNYLLLIDAIDLLPKLFEKIFVPAAVHRELTHPAAPEPVRRWATRVPQWLEILPDPDPAAAIPRKWRWTKANARQSCLLRPSVPT